MSRSARLHALLCSHSGRAYLVALLIWKAGCGEIGLLLKGY